MNSLYTRLFKYSPREGHLPLENFLTECFCDFLTRLTSLDRQASELFISEVLGGSRMPSSLLAAVTNAKELQWKTQHRINLAGDHGIVDLCLFADNTLVLAIENKIDAGFTTHRMSDSDEESVESQAAEWTQLQFYERYLTANCGASGLILMTHRTDAPNTFKENGKIFRWVCRWTDLYRWLGTSYFLDRFSETGAGKAHVLYTLAAELRQFLEDKQLITKEWNDEDLNVMKTFFVPDFPGKLQGLFQSVRVPIGQVPELAAYKGWAQRSPSFEVGNGIVWDWLYCMAPKLRWFISWGIASKLPFLKHYDIELDAPLQAVVLIGSDGQDIPCSQEELESWRTKGWTVYESHGSRQLRLLKTVLPEELFACSCGFGGSFEAWVMQAVREGAKGLQRAYTESINGQSSTGDFRANIKS